MKKKKKPSLIITLLKSPYYIGKGIYSLSKKLNQKEKEFKVRKKRSKMTANYQEFNTLKVLAGDFKIWETQLLKSESKIGIILGARGSGKTAIGIKILENIYAKTRAQCYALGFKKETLPTWISVIEGIEQIKNNSTVLIDEGGILFSSRKSMSKPNKLLSDLILIARHKNLNILFISQNSANLEINVIRQADFLILKKTSLLQKDFERKKIKDIYTEIEKDFRQYDTEIGATYLYSEDFQGFILNPLPSFWNTQISKSFRK